jgi:uncharacterized RDD family membrane protein YckC
MTEASPAAPSSGLVYADVPNRVIAYIIDAVLVAIVIVIIGAILAAVGLATSSLTAAAVVQIDYVATIILGLIGLAISGAYFIYMWTTARATIGMKALGLQIGNAGDGATITMEQGVRRYLALATPSILVQVFSPVPAIGSLLSLVALGWLIYLLYTTAKSPTKQGFHDVFANTQIVKTAKSVG